MSCNHFISPPTPHSTVRLSRKRARERESERLGMRGLSQMVSRRRCTFYLCICCGGADPRVLRRAQLQMSDVVGRGVLHFLICRRALLVSICCIGTADPSVSRRAHFETQERFHVVVAEYEVCPLLPLLLGRQNVSSHLSKPSMHSRLFPPSPRPPR